MAETSTKPYLIRAIHEWCSDNGFTPYIAVAVDSRTRVPREFVRNGEIVLNVSMMATHRLKLGNDFIEFQARFGGTPRELSIPVENVSAIYARENGHGMAFEVPKAAAVIEDDAPEDSPAGEVEADSPSTKDRPATRSRGPTLVPPAAAADDGSAETSVEGTASASSSSSASGSTDRTVAGEGSDGSAGPERNARGGRPLRSAGGRNDGRTGGRGEGGAKPEGTGKAEGAGKPPGSQRTPRGKQVLAVVPDNSDPKPPPAAPASTSRGDDEPPDPDDNPPRQSPPRLTRIK